MFFMFYVYIISSIQKPDEIYTGFTEDLQQRIEDHNSWKSPHTSKFIPWKLLFYSAFQDKQQALNFEKYLKTASGVAFRNKRLIDFT